MSPLLTLHWLVQERIREVEAQLRDEWRLLPPHIPIWHRGDPIRITYPRPRTP